MRWGGPASVAAGVLWTVVWLHQRVAHGATQVNEMVLVGGLTWMDSSKFVVPILLLVLVVLADLHHRGAQPGRLGGILAFGGLGFLMVATALEFWTFPWGSYAVTFEDGRGLMGSDLSAMIQALASMVFTLGLVVFGTDRVRARVIPIWVAVVLIVGGLTTVFLTPVFLMPGAAWFVLGLWLSLAKRSAAG